MSRTVVASFVVVPSSLARFPALHGVGSSVISAVTNGAERLATMARLPLPQIVQQARNGGVQTSKRYAAATGLHTSNQAPAAASLATSARQTLRRRITNAAASRSSTNWTMFTGTRNFSTSRPALNRGELSDSDLAHIAAQRQIQAASSNGILRPLLFTIGVSAIAWTGAEYWRVNKYQIYREWRNWKKDQFGSKDPHDSRMRPYEPFSNSSGFWSEIYTNRFSPAQKLMLPIVVFCSGVWCLWQYPVLGLRWMYKNWTHIPESGLSRTLLTSAFSHASFFHLAFNMLAMWSFSEAAYPLMGPEYYLATVASGAVVASFAQHAHATLVGAPNPALGASGFVFSIVTYVALSYPNNQALLFFVIPAPLLALLKGLVVFDLIGLTGIYSQFFNFRLAHAAHLGGVGLGAAVWWLNQRENRRKLADALPGEAVGLYTKGYDAIIKRSR